MKVASFDIFDTTLIRKCGNPNNVFYIMSKQLFSDYFALQKDFYNWRIHVEDYYRIRNAAEPDLYDLYDMMPSHLCQFYSAKEIAEFEKMTELNNLVANSDIKAIIGDYRNRGYTICFISDMYLDSQFLTSVLLNLGCAVAGEKVFVSNEFNMRKAIRGELYSVVRDFYPNTEEWIHYGDNYESDYRCAKKIGITAKHYKTDVTYIYESNHPNSISNKAKERNNVSLHMKSVCYIGNTIHNVTYKDLFTESIFYFFDVFIIAYRLQYENNLKNEECRESKQLRNRLILTCFKKGRWFLALYIFSLTYPPTSYFFYSGWFRKHYHIIEKTGRKIAIFLERVHRYSQ